MTFVYRRLQATLEAAARPWRADHRPRPGRLPFGGRVPGRPAPRPGESARPRAALAWRTGRLGALVTPGGGVRLPPGDPRPSPDTPIATPRPSTRSSAVTASPRGTPPSARTIAQAVLTRGARARTAAHPGASRLRRGDERDGGGLPSRAPRPRAGGAGRDPDLHHQHDPRAERSPGGAAARPRRRGLGGPRRGAPLRDRRGSPPGPGDPGVACSPTRPTRPTSRAAVGSRR